MSDRKRRLSVLGISFVFLLLNVGLGSTFAAGNREDTLKTNKLTEEEKRVIIQKGTERPFSGEYWDHDEEGIYVCKRCEAPLFRSEDKFDAHCGWPSFDDEIPEAIKRIPDADGLRTEITCARCGAHLGHVFLGENMTQKNTRHCVNSVSLKSLPAESSTAPEKAYFAGGCFWGVEYFFQKLDGVLSTKVGYMGGQTQNPTYEDVCGGDTGHAETVEITFDPSSVSYEKLARLFFEIHDPTQMNRQGPDIGDQYRSAVFYVDEGQSKTVKMLISALKGKGFDVVTEVSEAGQFWEAENYHQSYYRKNGHQPYCHTRVNRFGD
jgi:peptide methionine sulfoxide reductase msrA/msrB